MEMENKKRLIYANEAIEKINCLCVDGNENWIGTDNQSFVDHADVIDILSDMPIVDAVEVAHGRWIETKEEVWHLYERRIITRFKCSQCEQTEAKKSSYCPNCSAKMDQEVQ